MNTGAVFFVVEKGNFSILMLIIIGYLAGRESLRRINRWCRKHGRELKK